MCVCMHACVYVCMYIRMYACVHVCVVSLRGRDTHTHTHTHTRTYPHKHTRIHQPLRVKFCHQIARLCVRMGLSVTRAIRSQRLFQHNVWRSGNHRKIRGANGSQRFALENHPCKRLSTFGVGKHPKNWDAKRLFRAWRWWIVWKNYCCCCCCCAYAP